MTLLIGENAYSIDPRDAHDPTAGDEVNEEQLAAVARSLAAQDLSASWRWAAVPSCGCSSRCPEPLGG